MSLEKVLVPRTADLEVNHVAHILVVLNLPHVVLLLPPALLCEVMCLRRDHLAGRHRLLPMQKLFHVLLNIAHFERLYSIDIAVVVAREGGITLGLHGQFV